MTAPVNETPQATAAEAKPEPTPVAKPDMGDTTDWKAEAEKWKALSRKHEDAAKTAKDAATQAQKTIDDRVADLETKLSAADMRVLKQEVAAEKGIPADLLSGSTVEELTASADKLLAFRGPTVPPAVVPPATGQGNVGTSVAAGAKQVTEAELASMNPEQIQKALEDGRLASVLGQKTN